VGQSTDYFRTRPKRPELGLLRIQFGEFAAVMGLDVRVGVAPQSPDKSHLSILPGEADHATDRAERMM